MNYTNLRLLNFLSEWVFPPKFWSAFRHIQRNITVGFGKDSEIFARNRKFHKIYSGQRCFIIGNGASLEKQDLSPLSGEITIVMNAFNQHPILNVWQPTFLCMADPYLLPGRLKHYLENIHPKASFFNYGLFGRFKEENLFDQDKHFFVKMDWGQLINWPTHKSFDLVKPLPATWNTAHLAIMLALYSGCSAIYLIGFDHDWLSYCIEKRNYVKHFYDPEKCQKFFSYSDDAVSYKRLMEVILTIWRGYEVIQKVAAEEKAQIYNATEGGFLDLFPRVKYESLFPAGK